jgi:large subunit ribosomal protein L5e
MAFIKVIKDKSYFKRFQTQFRRRREGKTDYAARRHMVCQDKNKYNTPKYRLVVRFTCKDIICQICSSLIDGDKVMASAYSHELTKYGIPLGLTNYSAAYATGLLVARRLLQSLKLDTKFVGNTNIDGADYNVGDHTPHPFTALLDVGLARTSTGARVFAAMKGACDGGINVPHSDRRFVGYKKAGKEESLDTKVLRKYIFGGHVADYMRDLKDKNPVRFDKQFARYKKAGITPESIEKMYMDAHKKIRDDPKFTKKVKTVPAAGAPKKKYNKVRLTYKQRQVKIAKKKADLGVKY